MDSRKRMEQQLKRQYEVNLNWQRLLVKYKDCDDYIFEMQKIRQKEKVE